MELVLKLDDRGRLTLPKEVRKEVGIERFVKLEVKEGKLVLTPIKAPLEKLKGSAKGEITSEELDLLLGYLIEENRHHHVAVKYFSSRA